VLRRKRKSTKIYFFFDYKILIPIVLLTAIGLFAIVDVSAPKAIETFSDHFYFLKQQLMWVGVGLLVYLIFSQLNIGIWNKYAGVIFLLSVIFLLIVLIPGLGIKTYGAQRWLNFGFLNFQPSEFAKIAICIYLAKVGVNKKGIWSYLLPFIIISGLVVFQPDFGTAMVISAIAFAQIFISNVSFKNMFSLIFGAGLVMSILIFSSDYRRDRVLSFLNPFSGNSDTTYHTRQLLYALAIGGVKGSGIGQSTQKYLFLPEATTDSIFAVIAEEIGFLGVFVIIILYIYIFYNMIRIIKELSEPFSQILASGIFMWFCAQTFVNLASVSSLVPFTGVPLPFISYGGSALTSFFAAFGIFNAAEKYNGYHEK